MKFLKLFEEWNSDKSSVNESISTARERFLNTGKVSQEEFEEALSYDSSKTKKYLEKILDLYVKEREVNGKPMKEIGNTIEKFNELVQRNKISNSDVNYFKDYKSLKNEVENSEVGEVENEAEYLKEGDFDVIVDNKDLLVVRPYSHEASEKWGDTNWCTTSTNDTNWKNYTLEWDVNLFYIMVKNKSLILDWYYNQHDEKTPDETELEFYSKIAIAVYPYSDRYECFAKDDTSIEFEDVLGITGLGVEVFEWEETEKPFWWYDLQELELDKSDVEELEDGGIEYYGNVYVPRYCNPTDGQLGSIKAIINGDFVFDNEEDYTVNSMKECYLPQSIGGSFTFNNTTIENLIGSPQIVDDEYNVSDNEQLVSLEGAPEEIGNHFTATNTIITNLIGGPKTVGGDYDVSNNPNLISLEGAPEEISGNFIVRYTAIENLVGGPKSVDGNYDVSNNPNLISLEGAPKVIDGDFNYSNTPLCDSKNSKIKMTANQVRETIQINGKIINDFGEWGEGESDKERFYNPNQISMFGDDME